MPELFDQDQIPPQEEQREVPIVFTDVDPWEDDPLARELTAANGADRETAVPITVVDQDPGGPFSANAASGQVGVDSAEHTPFGATTVSRRKFLLGIGAAGLLAGSKMFGGQPTQEADISLETLGAPAPSEIADPEPPALRSLPNASDEGEALQVDPGPDAFHDSRANEAAQKFRLNANSYWKTTPESMEAMTANPAWTQEKTLLPIFPAAVMQYEDSVMRPVAEELGVPINVVAMIASIESAGNPEANSGVADGLFQVVVKWHREKIDRVTSAHDGRTLASDAERQAALREPYIGCRVGMEILRDYHNLVVDRTGMDENSPITWARALASYNGGPDEAAKDYSRMPLESQLYAVHAIRYMQDAAIAAELRNGHSMNNAEIRAAMSNGEEDPMAYAYRGYGREIKHRYAGSIEGYEQMWNAIIGDPSAPAELVERAGQLMDEYRQLPPEEKYQLPLTPALRIWTMQGGLGTFQTIEANLDPANYATS